MRINKFLSNNGIVSRRKADEYLFQGRITVNNITVTDPAFTIDAEKDKIRVDGELVKIKSKKIYIALNKPVKIITSVSDEKHRTTVIDLINIKHRIFPVGRLDYDTSGLIILTNDGEFANMMMHPSYKISKTYIVNISKPLEDKFKTLLENGVLIEGRKTDKCTIKILPAKDKQTVRITIREGRNRQIRKMFEKFGYFIRGLQRTEYGSIKLGNLLPGDWKYLSEKEIDGLKNSIEIKPKREKKYDRTKRTD